MEDKMYKNLLEQDWDEPSVEIAYATFAQNAGKTGDQPSCKALLRNQSNARGF